MTIYRTLLARGYFPKELPPNFYSEQFAKYAASVAGRATLGSYKPSEKSTASVVYNLALPSRINRELRVVHPFAFAKIASFVAEKLSRLLGIAAKSPFAKSRPIYESNRQRAIRPMTSPANLARERFAARAGASFVLQADVSQFYPSLYTHAVGWAIDPKLRAKGNWRKAKFLGARIDQALMDSENKISQGVAIGNDISFLLAECVLARVDRATAFPKERSYRWFDDYEIAFDTREQAEAGLTKLRQELSRFKLRLNPTKTKILELPTTSQHSWQQQLIAAGRANFRNPQDIVRFFDSAFLLREQYPESSILLYAMTVLFKIVKPDPEVGRIAQSCITQALLAEPGAGQKAFALLSFWQINGLSLDAGLLRNTICQMISRHQWRGVSSDIAWALAFCIEHQINLDKKAAKILCRFEDDCILLLALHLNAAGLLPSGFSIEPVERLLKRADLDREHWLLSYESVRQGFSAASANAVNGNALFADLLAKKINFYRAKLPNYALVLHTGGSPEWAVRDWLSLRVGVQPPAKSPGGKVLQQVAKDMGELTSIPPTTDETLGKLLDIEMKKAGQVPELPEQSVVIE